MDKKLDELKAMPKIVDDITERLDVVIREAWKIFVSQFLNEKYKIELEAPFQLHFASVLKRVGELYCLKRGEVFFVDLESRYQIGSVNDYVDITCGFIEKNKEENVPIELKFKTKNQAAENEGAIQIYKDIYDLENLINKNKNFKFAYFFMITDDYLYVSNPKKGSLRDTFNTSNGYKIESGREYKWTKTGKKCGTFKFKNKKVFEWKIGKKNGKNFYFLKMRIDKCEIK